MELGGVAGGLYNPEVGVINFLGLLVCPPVLMLAVGVALLHIAISTVVEAVLAANPGQTSLVCRVLYRLRP